MTVAVAPRKILFPSISGSTGPFDFSFRTLIRSGAPQIRVTKYSALGVPTDLSYPADYSFSTTTSGISGGRLTLSVMGGTGESLVVSGLTPKDQPVKYSNQGRFFPEVHEASYDQGILVAQEQQQDVDRSIKIPLADVVIPSELPLAASRANKALVFDVDGNPAVSEDDYNDQAADAAASAAAALANKLVTDSNVTTTTANAAAAALAQAAAEAAAAGMKYRSVRFATTTNDTLSGLAARDGVTPIAGDRAMAKNQSTAANNGLYVCAAGAWARAADMDSWAEVPGTVVVVTEGTANGDTVWLCTSNDGGTLGSTAITFVDWGATIIDGTLSLAKIAPQTANTIMANISGISGAVTATVIGSNQFLARSSTGNLSAKAITDDAFNFLAASVAANQFFAKGSTGNYVAKTISDNALTFLAAADYAAMRTALGVGVTIMAKRTPGAVTTDTQTGIPSGVKRITINFSQLTKAGSGDFLVQFGPSGGVETTGYVGVAARNGTAVALTTGIGASASWATGPMSGCIVLNLLEASTNTWTWQQNMYAPTTGPFSITGGGVKPLAGALERIMLTDSGGAPGNFSGGSWSVTYE